jgi:hypothetical protein
MPVQFFVLPETIHQVTYYNHSESTTYFSEYDRTVGI